MKPWIVALIIIGWIIFYVIVYYLGCFILDKCQSNFSKRWGRSEHFYYSEQKKAFKLYLSAFFIAILVLFIVSLFVEK